MWAALQLVGVWVLPAAIRGGECGCSLQTLLLQSQAGLRSSALPLSSSSDILSTEPKGRKYMRSCSSSAVCVWLGYPPLCTSDLCLCVQVKAK